MTIKARITLTAVVIFVAAVSAVVVMMTRPNSTAGGEAPPVAEAAGQSVRENSHRLNSVPDSDVTFVEFLDFECEGCRAVHPSIEQLRREYGDRVNFVIRYFPMPSHYNAERAARAVEAAAQQGRLEPMYQKMYETQPQWGEQQSPADAIFRGFANELGLDMAAFDAAYRDPVTLQRIQLDVNDGRALGVQGTPTFFINDTQIRPRSYEDLTKALDQALAE
jgi:protein-disulfide isomerase